MGEREKSDGDPAMSTLKTRGVGLGQENKAQEDEEELEELV